MSLGVIYVRMCTMSEIVAILANYLFIYYFNRSYSKFRTAEWEMNPNYCDKVKQTKPYNTGRRLLDLIDITIFDYLSGK